MKRVLSLILVLCMVIAFAAACGDGGTATTNEPSADGGGTDVGNAVTYGTIDTFNSGFNPLSSVEANSALSRLIYDYLIELDPVTCKHSSRICDEYYWEDDGVTYFFKLKEGITFSNGSELTGEDVLNSLYLMQNAGNSHSANFSVIQYDKCYVDDDGLGIHLVFETPYGPADSLLINLPILDKDFCDAHPDGDEEWWNNPVGSGPYVLSEYKSDSYIVATKRSDYWGEDIYEADSITVRYYSDSNTMLVDYQNGVIDIALQLTADQVSQVEADSLLGTVVTQSAADIPVICLNETREYLQNEKVREAIAYGIDWAAVADIAYGTLSEAATSHFGKNYSCYTEHEGYVYDEARAKQALADGGYAEGELNLVFLINGTTVQQRVSEAIQGYLDGVGIAVSIESYDESTFLGMMMEGDCDLSVFSLTGLGATLEPWNALAVYSNVGPFPCATVSDEEYNEMLNRGLVTNDSAERDDIYRQVDDWLYENYWAMPVCERLEAYCYSSRIASLDLPSVQGVALYGVHFA